MLIHFHKAQSFETIWKAICNVPFTRPIWFRPALVILLALFSWLLFPRGVALAAPPVDPLLADCDEGEFLHIHSGRCIPLHTTYGFDAFPEPTEELQLLSCNVAELRRAVSEGNRIIHLRPGCTYDLGDRGLSLKSNTVIDGAGIDSADIDKAGIDRADIDSVDINSTDTGRKSSEQKNSTGDIGAVSASTEVSSTESSHVETTVTCTGTTAFRIHDVSNVIVRNLTIDGQNDQQDGKGCGTLVFIDEGADNVMVERLRLRNGLGKGVGFRTATRVTVRYSWVEGMWDDHGLNADNKFVSIAYYSNYITKVGLSRGETGYGINSHASKAEIAGNYIENTDSGIKLMGARYTLLHHNTIMGASSPNPLYRGVWTAIDDKDNVRPISLVYYDNFIDTEGVRPFSVLDGATDIYLAGNHYGDSSNNVPISRESGVYHCANSSDSHLTGDLINVASRMIEFPDSGMGLFDPCTLQADPMPSWLYASPPTIRTEPQDQQLTVGEQATLTVSVITVTRPVAIGPVATGPIATGPSVTGPAMSSSKVISEHVSVQDLGYQETSYQWQRRIGEGQWFDLRNATAPSYTTSALRQYNNGNQYRVKVHNEFGSALSQVAVLTVVPQADFTEPCVNASSKWQSRPMLAESNRFRATFTASALTDKSDGLIGLSHGPASEFSDLAVIVRFGRSGRIDVRNALGYAADEEIDYSPGETFHFRLEVDVDKHIYSVYVASVIDGEIADDEVELADDYPFRSSQEGVKTVDSWSIWDVQSGLKVCSLQP